MIAFFRHLRAAWHYGRNQPFVPTTPDFWTEADQASLRNFFNSYSGLKLKQILTNNVIALAVNATQTTDHQPYKCGWASGARALVAMIESHFPISPAGAQSSKSEDQQQDAADILEQYAP